MVRFGDTGYGRFTPQRPAGPICLGWFDLFWVHRGRMRLELGAEARGAETVELGGGAGVLLFPHTPFVIRALTPVAGASVQHFDLSGDAPADLPGPLRSLAGLRAGYRVFRPTDPAGVEQEIAAAMELAFEPTGPWTHEYRVARLMLTLGRLEATPRRVQGEAAHPRWAGLLKWLTQQPDLAAVSVTHMARQAGLSESHFRARFRAAFGQSPGRYLQRRRLQAAARQLRETDEPIKQIAAQAGYDELANFYRAFRAAFDLAPAAYRQRHAPRA